MAPQKKINETQRKKARNEKKEKEAIGKKTMNKMAIDESFPINHDFKHKWIKLPNLKIECI